MKELKGGLVWREVLEVELQGDMEEGGEGAYEIDRCERGSGGKMKRGRRAGGHREFVR